MITNILLAQALETERHRRPRYDVPTPALTDRIGRWLEGIGRRLQAPRPRHA